MNPRKKLWIVQRQLAEYRLPVFKALSEHTEFTLWHTSGSAEAGFNTDPQNPDQRYGFSTIHVKPSRIEFIDPGLGLRFFHQAAKQHPDKVILTGDTRYLSFWIILIGSRLLGTDIHIHGHALLKKAEASLLLKFINKLLYRAVLGLCTGYIAYSEEVKRSFSLFGLDDCKVAVAENSIINAHPVEPEEKLMGRNGIFFCGRLRENHGLDLLIGVVDKLRNEQQCLFDLHIIGDGTDAHRIRHLAADRPWITLYGKVYDPEQIRDISMSCSIGCYPGTAGLSVVQYMSLSLVPITHDHMTVHGPEVSNIEHSINGILYDHTNPESSLETHLSDLYKHPEKIVMLQKNAFNTYRELIDPPLYQRLLKAVGW